MSELETAAVSSGAKATRLRFAKGYAALIVWIYLLALLGLTIPVTLLCGSSWGLPPRQHNMSFNITLDDALGFYSSGGYYILLGVLTALLAMVLFVPVRLAEGKALRRRHMWVPLFAGSFLIGNLLFAGVFGFICLGFGEKALESLEFVIKGITRNPIWSFFVPGALNRSMDELFGMLSLVGLLSLIVAYVFFLRAKADEPSAFMARMQRWLWRGGLIEVGGASVSHIVVRCRGDCCVPIATFWAIGIGTGVLLTALGMHAFAICAKARPTVAQPSNSDGKPRPNNFAF